ncbi:MAG: PilN domain-containing protein, partial [Motiliproteus sp.]
FWHWWHRELLGALPGWLRLAAPFSQPRAWLAVDGQAVRLVRLGSNAYPGTPSLADAEGEQARQRVKSLQSILLLPPEQTLHRSVWLPLAAEDNLAAVLCYELDRLTPFRGEQVYSAHRVLQRDTAGKRLQVELRLCPRSYLDPLLAQLRALSILPAQVTLAQPDGSDMADLNLLPQAQRHRGWRLSQLINALLLVTAVGLLAAWLLVPLYRLQTQAARLEPLLQNAHAQAQEAQTLRKKLQQLRRDISYLAEKHSSEVKKLDILQELTLILPDDTWVQQLQLQDQEVRLQGQAAEAATVVQMLENSPLLHRVKFRSPVTQDLRTDSERYHLSAELVEVRSP